MSNGVKLIPVEGNPFEGTKPKAESFTAEDLNIPRIPVPTKDTPEYLGAKVSLPESLKMFMGTMSTTDPRALQDIILKSVEGSQGGEDAEGNPYVVINGKPFYTNKQGLSSVDAVGFAGDILQFLPAAKLASLAKGFATRVGIGGLSTGAISSGKELSAQMLGSGQEFDTTKVMLDTAFGAGGQAVGDALATYMRARKPVFNASGEVSAQFRDQLKSAGIDFDSFGTKGKEAIVNAYRNLGTGFAKEAEKVSSVASQADTPIPLTMGQATGDVRQIAKEEAMRQGGRGGRAQKIMQEFEQKQKQGIATEATELGATIAPTATTTTQQEAGGTMYEILRAKQKELKTGARQAYDETDLRALSIPVEATKGLTSKVSNAITQGDFIMNRTLTPSAAQAYDDLVNIIPKVDKANVSQINLKDLERTRRNLGSYYKAAANDADRTSVSLLTKQFDDWLDDTITSGLASGDVSQLDKLKEARGLARDYYSKFKIDPSSPDVDEQKVIYKIVKKDLTPVETMNYLFGSAKLGENQTAVRVARRFKELFGADSPQFDEFRQAAYMRLVQDTQGNIKPAASIVREVDELIMGKGSALANEVFTADQVASLKEFRKALGKTVTPASATNPSKTGYEIARLGEDVMKMLGFGLAAGSGDLATGAAVSAGTLGIKPARNVMGAYQATKGVSAPTLQGTYGAPAGAVVGGIPADMLREREQQQFQGLLGVQQ
jgi:hypothetical protein